jgi:predicted AAA+ superfamily ATPase
MEAEVLALSKEYPVVLLTGSRQVGKSTLFEHLAAPERKRVSLDDLQSRELANNDPALFLELNQPPVLIDEIQYAPALFPGIKLLVDRGANPGDYWITGSQAFKMMQMSGESLAGRIGILHLLPMSQGELYGGQAADAEAGNKAQEPFRVDLEYLKALTKDRRPTGALEVFTRIFNGSMPARVSGQVSSNQRFYSNYIQTYLERDVRDLDPTVGLADFSRFLRVAAARVGQVLNVNDMAKDMVVRPEKVKAWLSILEQLDAIFYLYPYSNNVLNRAIKKPKLYFHDTGLVAYLTRWSSADTLEAGAMSGALFENYVVSEAIKSYCNRGLEPPFYFYRDRDQKEVDLLIATDGMLTPIEIKKTSSPNLHMAANFATLDHPPNQLTQGAIICMTEELNALGSKVLTIPVWAL